MDTVQEPLPSYDLGELVILIAEKHPTMRTIIRGVLHNLGVRKIYEASNPRTGFKTFCKVNPDIVFIDWGPDFDGIGFLDKIRKDKNSPNQMAPVIMVTPYTEESQVYEARDAGMSEFLAQPVSATAIYERIVSIIEHSRKFIHTDEFVGPDRRRHKAEYDGEGRREEDPTPDEGHMQ